MKKEETTATERLKVFCVNCKHCLMIIEQPGQGLCMKTTRNKTMDYVTGKEDYIWRTLAETKMYGQWWESKTYKQKRLFGIFPRKPKVVDGEKFWAKNCRTENPTGNCPTYEENSKDVRQATKGPGFDLRDKLKSLK